MDKPAEWTTYRTKCGRGRATFKAEWSTSLPWACYWQGTARTHLPSWEAAYRYFNTRFSAHLLSTPTRPPDDPTEQPKVPT